MFFGGRFSVRFEHRSVLVIVSVRSWLLARVNPIMAQSMIANSSDEPWRLANTLPRPVLFEIVLPGLQPTTRDVDDDPNDAIECCVHEDATVKMSGTVEDACGFQVTYAMRP